MKKLSFYLNNKKGAALAFVLLFLLIFSALSVPLMFSINASTGATNQSMLKEQAQLTANSVMESFLSTTQNDTMNQILTYVLKTDYKFSTPATIPTQLSSYTDSAGVVTDFLEKPLITLERYSPSQILVTSTINYKNVSFFNKNSLSVYAILDANFSGAENGGLTRESLETINSYSFIKTDANATQRVQLALDFDKNAAIAGETRIMKVDSPVRFYTTFKTSTSGALYLDKVLSYGSDSTAFLNINTVEVDNDFHLQGQQYLNDIPKLNVGGDFIQNIFAAVNINNTHLNIGGNLSAFTIGNDTSFLNVSGSATLESNFNHTLPSNIHVNSDLIVRRPYDEISAITFNVGGNIDFQNLNTKPHLLTSINLRPSSVVISKPDDATVNPAGYTEDYIYEKAAPEKFYPLKKLAENPIKIKTPSNLSRPVKMIRSADGNTITVTLSNGVFSEKQFKDLANNPAGQDLILKIDNVNSSEMHIKVDNDDNDSTLSFSGANNGKFKSIKYELSDQKVTIPLIYLYTTDADNPTKALTIKITDTDFISQNIAKPYFVFIDNNPNHSFEFGDANLTNTVHTYKNVSLYAPYSTIDLKQLNTEFIGGFLYLAKLKSDDPKILKVTGLPQNVVNMANVLEQPTDTTWQKYIKEYAKLTKWTVNAHLTKKPIKTP